MKVLISITLFSVIGIGTTFVLYRGDAHAQRADTVTVIDLLKTANLEEREYSKEYKKLYAENAISVRALVQIAETRPSHGEIGISLGEPSIPTVGGFRRDPFSELSCGSDSVLIGWIRTKVAHITDDRGFVYTQYEFVIRDTPKNNARRPVKSGDIIQITRPGGSINVNNQIIRVTDQSYPSLDLKGEYLIFLSYLPSIDGYLATKFRGVFELSEGERSGSDTSQSRVPKKNADEVRQMTGMLRSVECRESVGGEIK